MPTITHLADCLHRQLLTTLLGPMLAIADAKHLLLLEFTNRKDIDGQLAILRQINPQPINDSTNPILELTQKQLNAYSSGTLTEFSIPVKIKGSPFQEAVWRGLTKIKYGETVSYQELGKRIGRPNASRAIGSANGRNRIAIVIPCHRVIRADGSSGGYAGGPEHKQWLLDHESRFR